ncbi:MAG TPA: PspC domain-containing protein, partial [bacterium]|nr:PspC domain-containing protein [bacterium]
MDKTTSINLGGLNFIIEESAHEKLIDYLKTVKKHLGKDIDPEEVMVDIESSMAEKLKNSLTSYKEVVTVKDIEALITVMGTAEDFNREVGPEEESTQTKEDSEASGIKRKLYRDTDNAIISGVSAGLAAYFDIDPIVFRLLFVALIFANGFGLLAYLIFWIAMPEAKTASQKLEMHG